MARPHSTFLDEVGDGTFDQEAAIRAWEHDDETPEFTWLMVQAVSEKGDVMAWNVIDEGGKDDIPWPERQD